jgi:hypothetical protein
VAKVGTSKAGGTISQQAEVHPRLAADAHGNKETNPLNEKMSYLTRYVMYSQRNIAARLRDHR